MFTWPWRWDWTTERWAEYKVAYAGAPGTADALDCDIAGTYALFDKCGAAQASLHKRVSGRGGVAYPTLVHSPFSAAHRNLSRS